MQAPTRRAPVSAPPEQRTKRILYVASALGFVGLAAVIALFALGGGGDAPSAAAAVRAAGCTIVEKPATDAGTHVETTPKRSEYNTWPPTSGPHHPQYAPYDVYTDPVEQLRLVHNLEHGAIVIQYGKDVPAAEVDKIEAWYREDPNGLVVAPYPENGKNITLSAWTTPDDEGRGTGHLARCPRFEQSAFDAFKTAYAFRGPERFPEEQLLPGT